MRTKLFALALFFLLLMPSCGLFKEYKEYTTADKAFTLSFKREYKKTSSNVQADLQCVSGDETIQMVFFSYRREDLAETADSAVLLDFQIENMAEKRSDFTKTEETEIYDHGTKTIRRTVYSGVIDNKFRDYYIFSAADFKDDPEVILTAMQVVPVSKYKQKKDELKAIIESAKANKTF